MRREEEKAGTGRQAGWPKVHQTDETMVRVRLCNISPSRFLLFPSLAVSVLIGCFTFCRTWLSLLNGSFLKEMIVLQRQPWQPPTLMICHKIQLNRLA